MLKNNLLGCIIFMFMLGACKKKDDDIKQPPTQYTDKGFLLTVKTSGGSLTKYFDSIPTGTADLTNGATDYQIFSLKDVYDGAVFLQDPEGTFALSKYQVSENGEIVKVGEIVNQDRIGGLSIRDSETGVFYGRGNEKKMIVFNPTTMQISGTIDLSEALYPFDQEVSYREVYTRDNLAFAPLASPGGGRPWFDPLVVHVMDINSGKFVGNATVELGGPSQHFDQVGGKDIDEFGNLYFTDVGDLLTSTPARIHRINNGTQTIDENFEFDVAGTLNPQNKFFREFNSFRYIGEGKALAMVVTETSAAALALIGDAEDASEFSLNKILEIADVLYEAENAVWCVIDLQNKSVEPIYSIPLQTVNELVPVEYNGKWYLGVENSSEIAYYSYDPSTGETNKAFDVKGGGLLTFVNLSNNN